jgi:hypothetical protein
MITPRAPIEVMETKKSSAMFRSATTASGANGMTIHTAAAGMNMAIGAARKTHRSARPGDRFSLLNSLKTSAAGWRRPLGPTRFGP